MASKKELKRKIKKLQYKVWELERDNEYTERDLKLYQEIVLDLEAEIEQLKAPKVTMTDSNGNMADMTMVKNSAEIVLQDEYKALEQSHKQYQDLLAKIIALMVDELGVDIVRVLVDDSADEQCRGIALEAAEPSGKYARKGFVLKL